DHEDDGGQQSVDVERPDPLPVLAREADPAATARLVHPEVCPKELALAANGAAQSKTAPADGSPIAFGPPRTVMSGRPAPRQEGRRRGGRRVGAHAVSTRNATSVPPGIARAGGACLRGRRRSPAP